MPSRRQVLAGLGSSATLAVAGCAGNDYDDAADAAGDATDWPTFGHDNHNTNYNPSGSAPTENPTERWRVESFSLTAQPVIADGTVYAPVGADVLAIDAESGEVKWSVDPDNRAAKYWASPTVHDGVVYLGDGDERLRAFDAETGETLWTRTFDDASFNAVYGAPTLDFGGRLLYVGTTGGYVYEIDRETGEVGWKLSVFGQIGTTLAYDPPMLYAVTEGGDVYAVMDSGRGAWRTGLPDLSKSTPAVAGGHLYVGCFDGKVYALDSGRGRIDWSTSVGGFVQGGIAVADGRVFVDGGRDIDVLGADGGRKRWRTGVDSSRDHTPVVVGDTLYSGGDALYAFDVSGGIGVDVARVGATRFRKPFSHGVSRVAAGDGLLVAGVSTGEREHYVVGFE